MFFLAGAAASSALDLISSLQQTLAGKSSSTPSANSQSFDVGTGTPATSGGSSGSSATPSAPLAPATMDALLSAQGNGQTPMVNGDAFSAQLFSMLDANHDGAISQSEFDTAFGNNGDTTKADAIFAKLDANHDGTVSPDELTNALSGQGQSGQGDGGQQVHRHHHHHGVADLGGANSSSGASSSNSNDPFSSNDPSAAGDSSQTVTNADGSSTTTITYADGSQVTMTIPGASNSGSRPAAMAHSFIERMIQQQAQMMASSSSGQTVAISA
jgi:hypothetical protein